MGLFDFVRHVFVNTLSVKAEMEISASSCIVVQFLIVQIENGVLIRIAIRLPTEIVPISQANRLILREPQRDFPLVNFIRSVKLTEDHLKIAVGESLVTPVLPKHQSVELRHVHSGLCLSVNLVIIILFRYQRIFLTLISGRDVFDQITLISGVKQVVPLIVCDEDIKLYRKMSQMTSPLPFSLSQAVNTHTPNKVMM